MSDVGDAMRKAGVEVENAAVALIDYINDPEVRPVVRRSITATVTRMNDTANRLMQLADDELNRQAVSYLP